MYGETEISKDYILYEIDDYSYGFLICDWSPSEPGIWLDIWKRYPEFENKEDDEFWEPGDEYWYILEGPGTRISSCRFSEEDL